MEIEEKKNIDDLIYTSVSTLEDIASTKTVVGEPIITSSGAQVIPVSKVTMGYVTGGGEYGEIKVVDDKKNIPFAGGASAIVSIKPTGFIIDDGKEIKLVRSTDEPFDNLIEKTSAIIEKIMKGKEEYKN